MKCVFSIFILALSNICTGLEISDKCFGAYWITNNECSDHLVEICSDTSYWSRYSCVSTINAVEIKEKYKVAKDKVDSMISSENLCEKYGGLRQAHYLSQRYKYKVKFDLYEKAAKNGYIYAMKVLATDEKFYLGSIENAKKSIYWSLIYNYRLNQKTPEYEDMKKTREILIKKITKTQLQEIVELFLSNVKKIEFGKCADY